MSTKCPSASKAICAFRALDKRNTYIVGLLGTDVVRQIISISKILTFIYIGIFSRENQVRCNVRLIKLNFS
jgi:hypothetical protein